MLLDQAVTIRAYSRRPRVCVHLSTLADEVRAGQHHACDESLSLPCGHRGAPELQSVEQHAASGLLVQRASMWPLAALTLIMIGLIDVATPLHHW
jgi:hypothetical protein